jgi:hypothetical protein
VNRRAAGVATVGEERSVVRKDGDIRRPFGHGELVDRRKLTGVVGEKARDADDAPNAEDETPIEEPPEA